jgi:hypothetical protein
VRFARLDLDKYLGATVAARVVEAATTPGAAFDPKPLARVEDLGGEALQERRKLQSEIDLAKEEVSRAKDKVAWTEKLLAKGFVSQTSRSPTGWPSAAGGRALAGRDGDRAVPRVLVPQGGREASQRPARGRGSPRARAQRAASSSPRPPPT